MDIKELIYESINALLLNKMRTALATLGVIIGIGSVIALVSLGQASQKAVEDQIQSLGSNLLTIQPGAVTSGGVRGQPGSSTTLTMEDAEALESLEMITNIKSVSPVVSDRGQIIAGGNNTNTTVYGITESYADVRKIEIQSGRFITEQDNSQIARVAVIGPTTAETLFLDDDPIGQRIRINSQILTVIGVTASKGGSGFMNQDDMLYVPIRVAQKVLFGTDYLSNISVEALSADHMDEAEAEITTLLLQRHGITNPDEADFSVFSQNDILETASSATSTFTALLGGIAAISLVVGGIGIMNIMLVTVTERTREIGLRKALGATGELIVFQFLTETVMLTFFGGILGIMLGIIASFGISKILGLSFTVSLSSVFLAMGVSSMIGIIFGWYPAQKAAKLQPIEALRYE